MRERERKREMNNWVKEREWERKKNPFTLAQVFLPYSKPRKVLKFNLIKKQNKAVRKAEKL